MLWAPQRNTSNSPHIRLCCLPFVPQACLQISVRACGPPVSVERRAAFRVNTFGGHRGHRDKGRRGFRGGVWENVYRQGGMLAHLDALDRHLQGSKARVSMLFAAQNSCWHCDYRLVNHGQEQVRSGTLKHSVVEVLVSLISEIRVGRRADDEWEMVRSIIVLPEERSPMR